VLLELLDFCSKLTDVLAMVFCRASLRLKPVVFVAKRSRLLFQHPVLGFDREGIVWRLSRHAELPYIGPTEPCATA